MATNSIQIFNAKLALKDADLIKDFHSIKRNFLNIVSVFITVQVDENKKMLDFYKKTNKRTRKNFESISYFYFGGYIRGILKSFFYNTTTEFLKSHCCIN